MTAPRMINQSAAISLLLNEAQRESTLQFLGEPATPTMLGAFAHTIYKVVLRQVLEGLWVEHHVSDVDKIVGLKVSAVRGRMLFGEPPIKVVYDFTKTALPRLIVDSKSRVVTS